MHHFIEMLNVFSPVISYENHLIQAINKTKSHGNILLHYWACMTFNSHNFSIFGMNSQQN